MEDLRLALMIAQSAALIILEMALTAFIVWAMYKIGIASKEDKE